MIRRFLPVALALGCFASPAAARTAANLSQRIQVDGFTTEFTADETVFGFNGDRGLPQESDEDSKWGPDKDLSQIRITWDARFLYLGVEAVISDCNTMLMLDPIEGRGIVKMRGLNSWSRNISFNSDFAPDLFVATWDGNTAPRLLVHIEGLTVTEFTAGSGFRTAASFTGNRRGRAMEVAIPWTRVFAGLARDTVLPGRTDTLTMIPRGARLKIAGLIVDKNDNNGGPDAAPDNTQGLSDNSSIVVVADNYAAVAFDRNDDTGTAGGDSDGIADWDVEPHSRVSFRYAPPIFGLRLEVDELALNRPAIAPDRGEAARFRFRLVPDPDPADPVNQARLVNLKADVYDMRGRFVNLLFQEERPVLNYLSPSLDRWDGRDFRGEIVPPGTYVLRITAANGRSRMRPVVVVR